MRNFSMEKLRKRITEEMERNGDTQKSLAEKIGVSQADMSKILKGGRNISLERLVSIADVYGLSIDDLLGRSDTMSVRDICRAIVRMDQSCPISITRTDHVFVLDPLIKEGAEHGVNGAYTLCNISFMMDTTTKTDFDSFHLNRFLMDYSKLREVFQNDPAQLHRLVETLISALG